MNPVTKTSSIQKKEQEKYLLDVSVTNFKSQQDMPIKSTKSRTGRTNVAAQRKEIGKPTQRKINPKQKIDPSNSFDLFEPPY